MKKLYTLLVIAFIGFIGNAQIVNIPDANFKTRLLTASAANSIAATGTPGYDGIVSGGHTSVDTNGDGEIQVSEASIIKKLDLSSCISGMQIQNISGIEAFTSLVYLGISCNNLSDLSLNNPQLKYIEAQNNNFQTADFSQLPYLTYLRITGSSLTTIDFSNNYYLNNLQLPNNSYLEYIFIKNTSIFFPVGSGGIPLGISNNTALKYICAKDSELAKMQQHFANNFYGGIFNDLEINSYCSFVPGGVVYNIIGNLRLDNNLNGCDVSDLAISGLKFNAANSSGTGTFFSNNLGNYAIPVLSGNHTITPSLENPDYFIVSPTSATASFPMMTSPYTRDFCFTPNGLKNDLEVTIIPLIAAVPGFDAFYKIIYKNKGNQVANGSLSFNFNDAILDLVSTSLIADNTGTNSLNWNYTNLNPFETREIYLTFNINTPMEVPAVNGGDILNYNATIVGATDETPNDNTFTLNQTVVNSFDPNDKTCLEGTTITPSMVGQYVHYVIRFENTGTFAARNIVVKDMIDTTKFDITTLVPQTSSHNFITRITSTNKVEFIFENINLPFDDANNDGYVAFKIKTKTTLVVGNTFSNSANIYFDYNLPIVTNTATTTVTALGTQDFDFGSVVTLSPVPAKDFLTINTQKDVIISSSSIYNTLGQLIQVITNPNETIDVSGLQSGSYFIRIISDKGITTGKFIKD
jgi:uncharacterized repeat protein (TIGR01451 family)